jgi:hypothetical protein
MEISESKHLMIEKILHMRRLVVAGLLLAGCGQTQQPAKMTAAYIDFTYDSGLGKAFSMRIDSVGKVLVGEGRRSKKYYTGQLGGQQLARLDSLYRATPFADFDSAYTMEGEDAPSYKVVCIEKGITRHYHVYGTKPPPPLKHFAELLRTMQRELQLTPVDTAVTFESMHNFYPPDIADPGRTFLPPG